MITDKVCEQCGVTFQGRSNAKFCSDNCRWLFHANKPEAKLARKRLSGKGCKEKGARVEREVCQLINNITGDNVQRKLGQARDGGADADWGPFRMEIKARQTVSMPAWQQQVLDACAGTDMIPSVVWKRNGEEFWIALPFSAFVSVFQTMRLALESFGLGKPSEQPNDG